MPGVVASTLGFHANDSTAQRASGSGPADSLSRRQDQPVAARSSVYHAIARAGSSRAACSSRTTHSRPSRHGVRVAAATAFCGANRRAVKGRVATRIAVVCPRRRSRATRADLHGV